MVKQKHVKKAAADEISKTCAVEPVKVEEVKTPPAIPGAKDFDWQAEYPGESVFVFTASTGVTVGLAVLGAERRIKPGALRKLRHQNQLEQMWYLIERVSTPAALEVSDEFEDEDYKDMFEQWSEFSQTTAGE